MRLESEQLAASAVLRSIPQSTTVLDTDTHYWFYPSQQSDSKTLIFIHGYRGNHHGLEAIAGALPDFNIIIPDLPGFGKSAPFSGLHSIENYVEWLAEFISALALKVKPVLLGHSFGSIICAAFASRTDMIEKLILENPVSAPALKGPNAPLTKLAQGLFTLAEKLPLKSGERLLKSWPMVRGMSIVMTKSWNPKLRKWVHAQHDANFNDFANRKVIIEGYRASISTDVSNFADQFKVPTLLIIGSRDDITSPKQQFAMARKIEVPHSISQHMGVGHLTHYEVPAAVAADIRKFVMEEND
jgi:pimeloyl-ACP methyl ester carboxylesterase